MFNGLVDLNRDIVHRLIRLMKDSTKTRMIVGMCEKIYEWKSHSYFLKIRRQSRGCNVDCDVVQKLERLYEFKRDLQRKREFFAPGGYGVLFELLPYPSTSESVEGEMLLNDVVDVLYGITQEYYFERKCKSLFFCGKKNIEYDLLYWLFVLCNTYKNIEAKKKISKVLVHMHFESPIPLKMKSICLLLINSKGKVEVWKSLMRGCVNQSNKRLFIDSKIMSVLFLPLIHSLTEDKSAISCLKLLSETDSLEHKLQIINTPNFLDSISTCILHVLEFDPANISDTICLDFDSVEMILFNCCYRYAKKEEKYYLNHDFKIEMENVNQPVRLLLQAHNIPFMLLRIVTEVVPLICSITNRLCYPYVLLIVRHSYPLLKMFAVELEAAFLADMLLRGDVERALKMGEKLFSGELWRFLKRLLHL